MIKCHLESIKLIREQAASVSQRASKKMIERFSSKHPPAVYLVGTEVLVRRFNSKSRKKVGTKSASKSTRIVEGKIIDRDLQNNTYKIQYSLRGRTVKEWFQVSDVTSRTLKEEKNRHEETHHSPAATHLPCPSLSGNTHSPLPEDQQSNDTTTGIIILGFM